MSRSRTSRLPVPGPAFGTYPERPEPKRPGVWARGLQAAAQQLNALGRSGERRHFVAQVRQQVQAQEHHSGPLGSAAFGAHLRELRAQLGAQGSTAPLIAQAFATVVRATHAAAGLQLFDTQLIAARILLDNRLAEMATGEGKTHAVMLAAAVAALAGVPVHVVTANAYLAARDAESLAPVFNTLGLSVAAIRPGADDDERRATYAGAIAYCTASDLIFDYLRDRGAAPGAVPLLRGLCMALVDEADGVLIDEARTPFILAQEVHDEAAAQRHRSALALAQSLRAGDHFRLDAGARRAHLQPLGKQICASAAKVFGEQDALWMNRRFRDELIERALAALHLYQRDVHYLLREVPAAAAPAGLRPPQIEVALIEATTGRVANGRRWSNGLHQLIELKERLPPSPVQNTTAQLTFQRFFPRYLRLAGMSGTLHEARRELQQVYGLVVETVPLRLPGQRRHSPPHIHVTSQARWLAVVAAIEREHRQGRPVLIGTDSVADAERLSQRLHAAGLAHQCLHARQDAEEAACIARAGQAGAVTVATNMAGRGTDILLGEGVAERGGLHVIACQQNASVRIDRQLHGRAARGGNPGSVATMLALDEGLLSQRLPAGMRVLLTTLARGGRCLPSPVARALLALVQHHEEQRARQQRAQLLRSDRELVRSLGFGALAE